MNTFLMLQACESLDRQDNNDENDDDPWKTTISREKTNVSSHIDKQTQTHIYQMRMRIARVHEEQNKKR